MRYEKRDRVAVVTAAGDKAFSAGMDLKEAIPLVAGGDEMGYEDHTKRPFSDVFKPIIAAVNGYCIAGGLEFLQGTDLRIAAEPATFGLGEGRWGPAGGSGARGGRLQERAARGPHGQGDRGPCPRPRVGIRPREGARRPCVCLRGRRGGG